MNIFHTNSESAGVRMSAMPAATLHAPTPMFLIDVGYNSAVYVGIIVFPALIVNFPKLIHEQDAFFYNSLNNSLL